MSIERQRAILQQQLDEVLDGIAELKKNRGDNFSIKQLERTKKTVKQKLDKLNDQSRKDDVVTFEELGGDRIFIDEAHYYKNLAAFTKMRNVGGISQTEAMKSSDLYMKCRYLDELTGGRGVVFATGTPISNSMVEMYTMQKYLQYGALQRNDLIHFDAWASTFGETVTAIELLPGGHRLPGQNKVCQVLQPTGTHGYIQGNGGHSDSGYAQSACAGGPLPQRCFEAIGNAKKWWPLFQNEPSVSATRWWISSVDNMLLITNDGRSSPWIKAAHERYAPRQRDKQSWDLCGECFDIWQRTADRRIDTDGILRPVYAAQRRQVQCVR